MSSDEYAWWSYFYSEWIDTQSNSKWFRLWSYVVEATINNRTDWNIVAMWAVYDVNNYWTTRRPLLFTADNRIETYVDWVWCPDSYFWDYGWPIYRWSSSTIRNWLTFWNYIVQIYSTWINLITKWTSGNFWVFWNNIVSDHTFEDDGAWTNWWNRTFNVWWWATHTSWSTATLSQVIPTVNTKKYRVVINHTYTTWSLTVKFDAWTPYWFAWTDEYRITVPMTAAWNNQTLNITPSSTYDWTINSIQVNEYTATLEEWKVTWLTNTTTKPSIYSMWILYIGSWNKVDVVDTTTRTKTASLSLVDASHTIVSITEVWQSLIIWTTDWLNSKQYYWDRVSAAPSDQIDWKWLKITAATSDETLSYVVTWWDWARPKCFMVQDYQRTLLFDNKYDWSNVWNEWTGYHPSKRFNIYTANNSCIAVQNKNLYVPTKWCVYKYWTDIPWIKPSWNNKVKYTSELNIPISTISVIQDNIYITYQAVIDSVTYNVMWLVTEYLPAPTGYLVTNPIFWDNIWTEKFLNKLRIWFKNVPSTYWNIKVHAIVDDYKFFTFTVSWVSVNPTVWTTYKIWSSTVIVNMEVIAVDITWWAWTITLKTTSNVRGSLYSLWDTWTILKLVWTWDSSISYTYFNNMVLLKTIESDEIEYWNELIFWDDFIDSHLPNRHKIQFVIELSSSLSWHWVFQEVFDVYILSDIIDTTW